MQPRERNCQIAGMIGFRIDHASAFCLSRSRSATHSFFACHVMSVSPPSHTQQKPAHSLRKIGWQDGVCWFRQLIPIPRLHIPHVPFLTQQPVFTEPRFAKFACPACPACPALPCLDCTAHAIRTLNEPKDPSSPSVNRLGFKPAEINMNCFRLRGNQTSVLPPNLISRNFFIALMISLFCFSSHSIPYTAKSSAIPGFVQTVDISPPNTRNGLSP